MKKYNEIDIVARTIYGEARGEGAAGMQAVANVIMNRANSSVSWWGRSPVEVATRDRQFSTWNEGDPNREIILAVKRGDPIFDKAWKIAVKAVTGNLPDLTGGASHYHAVGIAPFWSASAVKSSEIGNHVFYRDVA